MKMPLIDAIVTALLGYAVVFFGLVLLMAVIIALGKVMTARRAPAPAPAAPPAEVPAAPGSAGEVKLFDVPDREAAMVMAIVAERTGKPLNQLRFKSIKEVKQDEV